MQKRTAAKVADMLGGVEGVLHFDGRPRKRPGKDRAIGLTHYGKEIEKVTPSVIWDVDKMSLLGAFQLVRIQQRATRNVMHRAMTIFAYAYWGPAVLIMADTPENAINEIDNGEKDTRELIRCARASRREIEAQYDIEDILHNL